MPQGVEHHTSDAPAAPRRVKIPLMPQGVEHPIERKLGRGAVPVKIPLMPQGVEHL